MFCKCNPFSMATGMDIYTTSLKLHIAVGCLGFCVILGFVVIVLLLLSKCVMLEAAISLFLIRIFDYCVKRWKESDNMLNPAFSLRAHSIASDMWNFQFRRTQNYGLNIVPNMNCECEMFVVPIHM